jgi:hypothetical protein
VREQTKDYTFLEEVTTGVVTITHLPGGFGQNSQKLAEPIEIIKTEIVDVGNGLDRPFKSSGLAAEIMPQRVRTCRSCGKTLTPDRHLNCKKCLPKLPDELDGLEYCGVSGE